MSYDLMFQKAVELQQNGALNEAEKIYRQILEVSPQNVNVWNMLGLIAQTKGLHDGAIDCFYQAIKGAPNHFPLYFNLAVSYSALGKYAEAIEAYKKVLLLQPDLVEAHYGLGKIYWQTGENDKAIDEFSMAKQYLPAQIDLAELREDIESLRKYALSENPTALFYLGRRSFDKGNYETAENYLTKADILAESSEIKELLAQTKDKLGKKGEALKIYYQALTLDNNDAVLTRIADLEADNDNKKTAEKLYKKALEHNPQNLAAHTNLANLLFRQNRVAEALEEYRQAIIIAPEKPELTYNLGVVLKSTGNYEQALTLMFQAYYDSPEYDDWALGIAETLTLLAEKESQKAQVISKNWLDKMPQNTVARHINAVLNDRLSDCEKEYNRLLFDYFAADYEKTLSNIKYSAVNKIADLDADFRGKILDLGCGSGLVGQRLKSPQNSFTGVDISARMIALARQKNVYEEFYEGDIVEYLSRHKNNLSPIIIAADVFCYFADLCSIFELCYPSKLIFSVESDTKTKDYKIYATGRVKHNPRWIKEKLKKVGYKNIYTENLVLRQENGVDVDGVLFVADVQVPKNS